MEPSGGGTVNRENPGVSLNFDAQALLDADEAEYQREEQERHKELQQLLTDAFDDLSDEDDDEEDDEERHLEASSASSQSDENDTSNLSASPEPHLPHNTEVGWAAHMLPQHAYTLAHTSTPVMGSAPPLATPAPYQVTGPHTLSNEGQYTTEAHFNYMHAGATRTQDPVPSHLPPTSYPYPNGQPSNLAVNSDLPQGAPLANTFEKRGETEGGNDHNEPYYDPISAGGGQYAYPHTGGTTTQHPMMATYHDKHATDSGYNCNTNYELTNDHQSNYYTNNAYNTNHPSQKINSSVPVPQSQASNDEVVSYQGYGAGGNPTPLQNVPKPSSSQAPSQLQTLNNYKVQYMGNVEKMGAVEVDLPDHIPAESISSPTNKDFEQMQTEFINQAAGSPESRRLSQLQILYNARGRKIEELDRELKQLQDDSDREIRILKHQLVLSQDEKDGMANSIEQSQQLLQEAQRRDLDQTGQLAALQATIQALSSNKDELLKKLQASESTIESLNAQLVDLGSSDSLSRARDQHESIVKGMQKKYDAEIFALKEKIDAANREKEEKGEEVSSLKRQVSGLVKASEDAQIGRADTINRLTRSLEESQRQCQDLLEAGTGHELSRLKLQLQEVIAGKSITEDMNASLQDEVREMREQIIMYESASSYGVLPGGSTNMPHPQSFSPDDSYAQLGIKKQQSLSQKVATPESLKSEDMNLTKDETLHGLKGELERCLAMYRNKRQQVALLQDELKTTKTQLEEAKIKLTTTENQFKTTNEKLSKLEEEVGVVGTGGNLREARLQREIDNSAKEKETLLLEIEELSKRIEEIATSEEQTKEANRELSAQMAQMVREFDEDKRQALDRCQETCLQHHETIRKQMQEELIKKFNEEKEELVCNYVQQIKELKEELADVQGELDEVKSLYVAVCETKDRLQEEANRQVTEQLAHELQRVKAQIESDKDREVEQLKLTLTSSSDASLAATKDKWIKDQELSYKQKLETEVAVCKVEWFKEHAAAKDSAIQNAVSTVERHWQQKWEAELDQEVENKLVEVRAMWEVEKQHQMEREYQRRLEKARQTWQLSYSTSEESLPEKDKLQQFLDNNRKEPKPTLDMGLEEAKKSWMAKQKKEFESEIEKEKQQTNVDLQNILDQLKEEVHSLKNEKHHVEQELSNEARRWQEAKHDLLQLKDTERREAVTAIQDQCEKDYREFLTEHQDTLNKALKSAREQFNREKSVLIEKHDRELAVFKEKEAKWLQTEQNYKEEKTANNSTWQQKLEDLEAKHQQEMEEAMKAHRDNLYKALEEARARWQKKFEEALSESAESTVMEQEQQWAEERERYETELQRREDLLKATEHKLEEESTRLQEETTSQHQGELQNLQLKHSKQMDEQLQHLQLAHSKQMDEQLEQLRMDLEKELEVKVSESMEEKESLEQQLEQAVEQLKSIESRYSDEVDSLKQVIAKREKELSQMVKELGEIKNQVQVYDGQKEEYDLKKEEYHKRLKKSELLRQETLDAYKSAEIEHDSVVNTYKERQGEMAEKIQKLERKLKSHDTGVQRQLETLHESLEREHSVAMEKMKSKMVELRSNHMSVVEEIRKKCEAEKLELHRELERVQRHAHRVAHSNTPTQTEEEVVESQALKSMRTKYIDVVSKMKEDVLHHVSSSNSRAAETVQEEVVRERQTTAKRLRRYYMKCLAQLLDKDYEGMEKTEKLAFMEQALDNLPERESSCSGSRSSSAAINSGTATPVDSATITTRSYTQQSSTSSKYASGTKAYGMQGTLATSPHNINKERHNASKEYHTASKETQNASKEYHHNASKEYQNASKEYHHNGSKEYHNASKEFHHNTSKEYQNASKEYHHNASKDYHNASKEYHHNTSKEYHNASKEYHHSASKEYPNSSPEHQNRSRDHHVSKDYSSRDASRGHSHKGVSSWVGELARDLQVRTSSPMTLTTTHVSRSSISPHTAQRTKDSSAKASITHQSANKAQSRSRNRKDKLVSFSEHSANSSDLPECETPTSELLNTGSSVSSWHVPRESRRSRSADRQPTSSTNTNSPQYSNTRYNSTSESKSGAVASTRQSHVTAREPRNYYDINRVSKSASTSSKSKPLLSNSTVHTHHLTKLNSDTFLLTPESHIYESTSLNDIHESSTSAFRDAKNMLCQSDDSLIVSTNQDRATPSQGDYNYNAMKRSKASSSYSLAPSKSQSMPDVADHGDGAWPLNGSVSMNDLTKGQLKSNLSNYHIPLGQQDSGDSYTADPADVSPHVTTRSRQRRENPTLLDSLPAPYRSSKFSSNKKEGHHVSFKNVGPDESLDNSDAESVKSFASSSSISSFRQALKSKYTTSNREKDRGGKKPMKVLQPSEALQQMMASVPDNLHRPVAMVTRQTQVSSPLFSNRRK